MSDVLPLRARPTRDDRSARIGMIVFIAGWTMMFAAVLVTYALLRENAPTWPPPGAPTLDYALPSLATAVIASSSATMHLALRAIAEARARALTWYLVATIALGSVFVALLATTWLQMRRRGLDPSSSLYAASFFGLTLLHAAHVLVGIGGLASLLPRARRGAFSARAHTAVQSWGLYWHFVSAVWLVVFATVYLW